MKVLNSITSVGANGYEVGSGGTVTQATSRTTGVTLNKLCGAITTNTTALLGLGAATFTVTNSLVGINDVVKVGIRSGATNVKTDVRITTTANGSFSITIHNMDAVTSEIGAIIINFAILKAVVT